MISSFHSLRNFETSELLTPISSLAAPLGGAPDRLHDEVRLWVERRAVLHQAVPQESAERRPHSTVIVSVDQLQRNATRFARKVVERPPFVGESGWPLIALAARRSLRSRSFVALLLAIVPVGSGSSVS